MWWQRGMMVEACSPCGSQEAEKRRKGQGTRAALQSHHPVTCFFNQDPTSMCLHHPPIIQVLTHQPVGHDEIRASVVQENSHIWITSCGHALDISGDTPYPNHSASIIMAGGIQCAAFACKEYSSLGIDDCNALFHLF